MPEHGVRKHVWDKNNFMEAVNLERSSDASKHEKNEIFVDIHVHAFIGLNTIIFRVMWTQQNRFHIFTN